MRGNNSKIMWIIHAVFALAITVSLFLMFKPDNRTKLYVYNWSDYMDPEVLAAFEKENNCHVVVDNFSDNESMLAKLMSGATGYDVIFPSSYTTPVLVKNNLIRKLDMTQLPNVKKNFDNKYNSLHHEYTLVYSVPYAFSMTGIAYRKDKVDPKELKNSWKDLMCPAFGRRVSILRDIREMLGIGLIATKHSVNTDNPKDLEDSLEYIKPIKLFSVKMDNEMYRTALASEEIYACIGYNSDVVQIMQENEDCPIGFYIPEEGSTCCWDEMVIPSTSSKQELAHKFIDYFYDPGVAAKNMSYMCSTVPNTGIWEHLDEEYINNELVNVPSNTIRRLQLIKDVGDNLKFYNEAWDKFMTFK